MAKRTGSELELSETQFPLHFAFKATLYLHGKSGADLAEPGTIPKWRVEMEMIKITPGDGLKRGRRTHRTVYFQPELGVFTKTPNGKKTIDDITNADQVAGWIRDEIASLGGSD